MVCSVTQRSGRLRFESLFSHGNLFDDLVPDTNTDALIYVTEL